MDLIFSDNWNSLNSSEKKKYLKEKMLDIDLTIIYLDDDESALEIFSEKMTELGLSVFATTKYEQAIHYLQKYKSKILFVISDYNMPEVNGFQFRNKVVDVGANVPFYILSGYADRDMAIKGIELKISGFLDKPLKDEAFFDILKKEGETRATQIKEDHELLQGFLDDASNLLDKSEGICLELESNPNDTNLISSFFGMIHTIKGSSGFFEPNYLHKYAHVFEDVLKEVQAGTKRVTPALVSVFLKAVDQIKAFVSEFKVGEFADHDLKSLTAVFSEKSSDASSPKMSDENSNKTIPVEQKKEKAEVKVSMDLLDEFMQISGEMTVIRNMINKSVRSIEKQYQGDKDVALLGELLSEMHKINSDVQSKITDIRRVSVNQLLKPIQRTFRDTCRALNKKIDLIIEGDELRLDNSIAEVLSHSLIHLIRNSMDHGIESLEKRMKAQKNPVGKVFLRFKTKGESILVEIEDDGGGINEDKIKEKIINQKMKTETEVHRMSPSEIHLMIFESGFSTAEQLTEFSGRGVGMSMVKESIESINGKIMIESRLGQGSKFSFDIPIPKSVLITNCLFVQTKNHIYGFPQDLIIRVLNLDHIKHDDIQKIDKCSMLRLEDNLLPIFSISETLGHIKDTENEKMILILKTGDAQFALTVNKVLDIEDTVIKPMASNCLKKLEIYLGGTFLGDGTVGLIFNIEGLAKKLGITNKNLRKADHLEKVQSQTTHQGQNIVIFELPKLGKFCLPEKEILRIESIPQQQLQKSGNWNVIPYRNSILSIINLENILSYKDGKNLPENGHDNLTIIVVPIGQTFIGALINEQVDLIYTESELIEASKRQIGIKGCLIVNQQTISVLSLNELISQTLNEIDTSTLQNNVYNLAS